jgi:ubiquinone biosynthesis protein
MNVPQARTSSGRYRQVAEILARHGLGYLVGILGLERFVPFHRGILGHPRRPEPYTRPEHVRMALEELGATFTKLGQIVSTRSDLVPPDYQAELAKLQDAAPTVSIEEIREALLTELGRPLEEFFASFDPAPLAAASIGQAHAATLPDGTEVVVKVRRPGVVEQVEADLAILQNLAVRASHRWEMAKQYDLVTLVQEFAQTLREELDYIREGRNAERFAANFSGDPTVHIPRIFWETTTARVLTLERLHGMKIDDVEALAAAGIDRKELAVQSSRILLKMVFDDGFFHADPHPGNFFVEPDGRIGIVDFGMVGVVDDRTEAQLVAVLLAITSQDAERLSDAFLDLGMAREHIDREALQRDLQHLVSRYYGQPLGEIALGPLLQDALGIVRRHHLQLPSSLALLLKTVVMSEGVGVQLDPEFRLTSVLAPYAQHLMLRQYSPALWARRLSRAGLDAARLGVELPEQARRILGDLERGNFEVGVRPMGFEPLMQRAEQLINRLVLGMIAAAFIVGLAFLMSVYHPFGGKAWMGPFFAIGFVIAAMLGVYLAWSILRSGRG